MSKTNNLTVDANGFCAWTNSGTPKNPQRIVNPARLFISPDLPATATSYQLPGIAYLAGDLIHRQRLELENDYTFVVPAKAPPPPPPPPVGVPVSAAVPLPASVLAAVGPLHVAMLEGFASPAQGGMPLGTAGAIYAPSYSASQDPMWPFNQDERAVFAQKNATILLGGGLDLVCQYTPGVGKTVVNTNKLANYTSGAASSLFADPKAGGAPGFPMQGFKWAPLAGMTFVESYNITVPPYEVGMDFGLWWQSSDGSGEKDIELMDEVVNNPGMSSMIFNVLDHIKNTQSPDELQVFNSSFLKLGGRGELTIVNYGVTNCAAYITPQGGATALLGTFSFPVGWSPTKPMASVLSFGLRSIETDEDPTWTDDHHAQVWTSRMWATNLMLGNLYGGGLSPGTLQA